MRLFEAGRLLTFLTYRMGAYSRWALIRGWALNRINTVNIGLKEHNRDMRNFGTCQQGKWNRNSSNSENNLNANKKKRYQRVSMGLTVSRKTAQKFSR